MNDPGIVLDTCVLNDREFLGWLSAYHGRKIISAVTYMEFMYYLILKGENPEKFRKMLNTHQIEIENFSIRNADSAVKTRAAYGDAASIRCPECGKPIRANWCDLMVASHALYPPWIVVTKNIRDFEYLGGRVMEPRRFMNKFGRR